jgi:hypothetical protein
MPSPSKHSRSARPARLRRQAEPGAMRRQPRAHHRQRGAERAKGPTRGWGQDPPRPDGLPGLAFVDLARLDFHQR